MLTPSNLGLRDSGRRYLQTLVESTPEWTPDRCNYFEPVNRPFDPADIEGALGVWLSNFLWRKKSPSLLGSVWAGRGTHSTSYVRVPVKHFRPQSALAFVEGLHRHFPIDLAYVHVPHDDDWRPA